MVLLPQVTRQLFEPLVMQLIHWFTNNKKFESQDTVALLETILVSNGCAFPVVPTDCLYLIHTQTFKESYLSRYQKVALALIVIIFCSCRRELERWHFNERGTVFI